jgi:predicted MFS family arabinose efflux permease
VFNERLLLSLLAAVQFLHIVDFMIMMPLQAFMGSQYAATPAQFAVLLSAYSFSAGVVGFLFSFWSDRLDRKTAFMGMFGGFALATLGCALAPDYYSLAVARAITGGFGGVLSGLSLAIIGDSFPPERRGTAMGVVMGSFSLATVAGVPSGLWLASHAGWQMPFLALGVLAVGVWLVVWQWLPPMRGHLTTNRPTFNPVTQLERMLRTRGQRVALLLSSTLIFSQFLVIPSITPYLIHNAGLPRESIVLVYLVGGVCTILTSPLIGRLADRLGKAPVFRVMATISLIPILGITQAGIWPLGVLLVITSLLFISFAGRAIPSMALITGSVRTQDRGGFMGINSSFQQVASSLAALVSGSWVIVQTNGSLEGYASVGYLAAAVTVLTIGLSYYLVAVSETAEPLPSPLKTKQ